MEFIAKHIRVSFQLWLCVVSSVLMILSYHFEFSALFESRWREKIIWFLKSWWQRLRYRLYVFTIGYFNWHPPLLTIILQLKLDQEIVLQISLAHCSFTDFYKLVSGLLHVQTGLTTSFQTFIHSLRQVGFLDFSPMWLHYSWNYKKFPQYKWSWMISNWT